MPKALPKWFEGVMQSRNAVAATKARLEERLRKESGKPLPKTGSVITSADIRERYAFSLPDDVGALLEVADRFMIEDVEGKNFRFVRVAPGGWELPTPVDGEEYAVTVAKRFDWNTFSNMQLWEHFAGLMPLGWDRGDNRYEVATTCSAAPVFWLDHETADVFGAVAPSLHDFLQIQYGDEAKYDERTRKLALEPGHWDRDEDGLAYHERTVPLAQWPPFLAARSEWIVAGMAFGSLEGKDKLPEVGAFDLDHELPLVRESEPLALYWLMRAYYLEERDVFDEVGKSASKVSPLAASIARLCEARWNAKPKESAMAKVREQLRPEAKRLREAKWPKGLQATDLV
jgi:hypothetical protein